MNNFKNFCLISLLLTTLIGCAEKSKTPTEFHMTLGGLSASGASDFLGGIVLKGTNGSENFRVGVTPDKVGSFSMELPNGDWNFTAVGWLNDTSQGVMTGQARCGFASSKIDSSDTTISMALSQANCTEGKIATAASLDESMGTGLWFKKLNLISCLNPDGITAGDLCNGPELNRLPGMAAAVRVVFPGKSNFDSPTSNLRSRCLSHEAALDPTIKDFSTGLIPTPLRLPFLGTRELPWVIETFSDVNCQEYEMTYALPDGLIGTQGVYRLVDDTPTDHIRLNFADNGIGKVGSLFDDATLTNILPSFSCGNNCYDSSSFSPSGWGGAKDDIRDKIWRELGNIQGFDSNDIVGADRAQKTITDGSGTAGVTAFAPMGSGSAGNNIKFSIQDTGADPVTVSCDKFSITVGYSSAQSHTDVNIANAITGSCGHMGYEAQAVTGGTVASNNMIANTQLAGGTTAINPIRREEGRVQSIKRILYGAIGIGLKSQGITPTTLCDGSMDGVYEFNIPAGRIKMHLATPTPSAVLPGFATYSLSKFERKILVEKDGKVDEAFYFNCSEPYQTVGAHLSSRKDNTSSKTLKQIYWDTTTAGGEWLETGSQTVNTDTSELIRQSSFVVKFVSTAPDWNAWLMRYHDTKDETDKVVGSYAASTAPTTLYTQKTSLIDSNTLDYNKDSYQLQTDDQVWDVSTNTRNTPVAAGTPAKPPTPLDAKPNIYSSYTASDFEAMNSDFWDFDF